MKLNFELKNWSDYQQGQLYEGKEFITRVTMQPEPPATKCQLQINEQNTSHMEELKAAPLNSLS